MTRTRRVALYGRVSTLDQEPENQLVELRTYAEARGWPATEYVDRGVSGAKDRRPAWTGCWLTLAAADSTCWSAGGSTATCAIW